MNPYNNSKIYKIISDKTDLIYIGSTYQKLYLRKNDHKKKYRKWILENGDKEGGKGYYSVFKIFKIDFDDFDIILIENYNCDNKEELHSRERYYIDLHKEKSVNMVIPTRTHKEWIEDQGEEYKIKKNEKNKEKYQENKEELKKKNIICECGILTSKSEFNRHIKTDKHNDIIKSGLSLEEYNIKKHSESKKQNKEYLNETMKKYRLIKGDVLREQARERYKKSSKEKYLEKITCECGSSISRIGIARHKRSKQHLNFILDSGSAIVSQLDL